MSALVPDQVCFPALQRLLAVGRHTLINEPLRIRLCRDFGLQPQADWPIAALSWLGQGGEPGGAYWLHADPVHFVLQRDSFSLGAPAPLPLNAEEAQVLAADLNRHFLQDGLQFHVGHARASRAGHWYVQLSTSPDLSTCLPECVIGQDTRPYAPQGSDAAGWRRIGNEIQMLLHDHPVNHARESRGELPVNSLWFSAGGVQPLKLEAGQQTVFSGYPLLTGLALAAHLPHAALPANMHAVLEQTARDVTIALENIDQAEQDWFMPLRDALRRRIVRRAELYFAMRDQVMVVQVRWYDLFKFWRRAKPLGAYLSR